MILNIDVLSSNRMAPEKKRIVSIQIPLEMRVDDFYRPLLRNYIGSLSAKEPYRTWFNHEGEVVVYSNSLPFEQARDARAGDPALYEQIVYFPHPNPNPNSRLH
jgi:hypothetical protein